MSNLSPFIPRVRKAVFTGLDFEVFQVRCKKCSLSKSRLRQYLPDTGLLWRNFCPYLSSQIARDQKTAVYVDFLKN